MKRKCLSAVFFLLLLVMIFPAAVNADVGPKPSVVVAFQGLGDELCYGTLLSENESTGPSSIWDGREETAKYRENQGYDWAELDHETWKAFVSYEDADGYHFLQEGWRVDETKELAWTYYPPYSFKILLYFPERNAFAVSGVYERYAFDSYFTVDMNGVSIAEAQGNTPVLTAEKSYDHTWELISLAVRTVITILLEICTALLFGYRAKKQLLCITAVNVVTQIILNVALNVINYRYGYMAFTVDYVLFEIAVFVIEAVLFCRLLPEKREKPQGQGRIVAYAFAANGVSFAAGFAVAKVLPGIF